MSLPAGIDCLYTGAQKVLSAPSGASPISFSKRANRLTGVCTGTVTDATRASYRTQAMTFWSNRAASTWLRMYGVEECQNFGGTQLNRLTWNKIFVSSGSGLASRDGIMLAVISHVEKVKKRLTEVRSLYFDMNHLANYWGCDGDARRYHHTGPISCIYAIREGLAVLAEQGLEESWKNHKQCAELLHEGLEKIGLELLVKDKSIRNPCVTAVKVPDGVDWKSVIEYTRKTYRVEIGAGLGALAGKVWRIGLMGYNCTPDNVRLVLRALEEGLRMTRTAKL